MLLTLDVASGGIDDASADVQRASAACLRLARLYGVEPLLSDGFAIARSRAREGILHERSCASTAREWHLGAFDACQQAASSANSNTDQQQVSRLARESLLRARTQDLIDAARCGSAATVFERSFGTEDHRQALFLLANVPDGGGGVGKLERDAWAAAFPQASRAVDDILAELLEAASRRHTLLESEREHAAFLRESQSLVQVRKESNPCWLVV
jgi:hypothetical protein